MLWFLRFSVFNQNPDYQQSGVFPYNFWQADMNFISNKRESKILIWVATETTQSTHVFSSSDISSCLLLKFKKNLHV